MRTDPTTVLDPTAATEAVLDIDSIKEMMDACKNFCTEKC